MTAAETIELAQGSVDQIQRGIATVQDKLEQADVLVSAVDDVVETVTIHVRRMPRRMLICGIVALFVGVAAIVLIKKKKASASQESEEILT